MALFIDTKLLPQCAEAIEYSVEFGLSERLPLKTICKTECSFSSGESSITNAIIIIVIIQINPNKREERIFVKRFLKKDMLRNFYKYTFFLVK